jgi:pyruvate dehydrogenase E1 component alpha subunit
MLLEALNLAVVWRLPAIFVCKDNRWAITTLSTATMSGSLVERARGFGLAAQEVDGTDVEAVWAIAHEAMQRGRQGGGPTFIHATCCHPEGHFLGDQLIKAARQPFREMLRMAGPLIKSLFQVKGAPLNERLTSLMEILGLIRQTRKALAAGQDRDPIMRLRLVQVMPRSRSWKRP